MSSTCLSLGMSKTQKLFEMANSFEAQIDFNALWSQSGLYFLWAEKKFL